MMTAPVSAQRAPCSESSSLSEVNFCTFAKWLRTFIFSNFCCGNQRFSRKSMALCRELTLDLDISGFDSWLNHLVDGLLWASYMTSLASVS
jgi:hypothetical protein